MLTGILGTRTSHKGKDHVLLLVRDDDDCFHFVHAVDMQVERRINFGYDPMMAVMCYNHEVAIFREWVRIDV